MKQKFLGIAAGILLAGISSTAYGADYGINSSAKSDRFEVRGGLLAHNQGPVASSTESGPDIALALHYTPWVIDVGNVPVGIVGHVGTVLNLSSGTSYAYVGANTHIPFANSGLFFEFGGGFAVHDGNLKTANDERRALGSRILFRAEINLGYKFDNGMTLSFMVDHISNGSILSSGLNQGLDTFGVRLGQSF